MVNDGVTTIHGSAEFLNGVSAADTIQIKIAGTDYTTEFNNDGSFEFVIPQSESDETYFVHFHGPNIMHDAVKLPVSANAYDAVVYAKLSGRNAPIPFDVSVGGTLENTNSYNNTKVTVPPNAFVLADGTVATGEIQVQITEADINNLSASGSWANNLYGTTDESSDVAPLVTYGLAEFYFSQNGEELQLRDGFSATLQWDLLTPKMMDENGFYVEAEVGDSIPLWYYDHGRTLWIDEGVLAYIEEDANSPTGLAQVGEVTHFSHYNTDRPCPPNKPPKPPVQPEPDPEEEDPIVCPHNDLTCYWNFSYRTSAAVTVTLADDSTGTRYSADSWNITIDGQPHHMTNTNNEREIVSGTYVMDWLGNIDGAASGNAIIEVISFTTNEHPGRVIDFAEIAAYNNFNSGEADYKFQVPWSSTTTDGTIFIDLEIALPPY
jgi:hypothetical protein